MKRADSPAASSFDIDPSLSLGQLLPAPAGLLANSLNARPSAVADQALVDARCTAPSSGRRAPHDSSTVTGGSGRRGAPGSRLRCPALAPPAPLSAATERYRRISRSSGL